MALCRDTVSQLMWIAAVNHVSYNVQNRQEAFIFYCKQKLHCKHALNQIVKCMTCVTVIVYSLVSCKQHSLLTLFFSVPQATPTSHPIWLCYKCIYPAEVFIQDLVRVFTWVREKTPALEGVCTGDSCANGWVLGEKPSQPCWQGL